MLPGFRFLFAAIVLSMSVLVFGLGAAALLRAAHEQFASIPSRRAPPEPVFAKANEPPMPTLALLRFEPPTPAEVPDNVPKNAATTALPEPAAPATQTQEATPAELEKPVALKTEEPVAAEPVKPETATAETTPVTGGVAATVTPTPTEEVKLAAIAEIQPPATAVVATAAEPAAEIPSLEGNIAATRIATLGGPAVTIEDPASANKASAKPSRSAIRKRARERRRIAARRAALLAQQAAAQQQAADPFALPAPAVTRAKR
jgi:hypothetical protein